MFLCRNRQCLQESSMFCRGTFIQWNGCLFTMKWAFFEKTRKKACQPLDFSVGTLFVTLKESCDASLLFFRFFLRLLDARFHQGRGRFGDSGSPADGEGNEFQLFHRGELVFVDALDVASSCLTLQDRWMKRLR